MPVSVSGAGPHFEPMTGYSQLMKVDTAARPDTVRHAPDGAEAVAERPSAGHRRLPAKLVTLTLGIAATGVCLLIAAILVRAFANGQSSTVKWILIGGAGGVLGLAAGLLSQPVVVWVQRLVGARPRGE